MKIRRSTVEHPFDTIKHWMGHTHFQMKGIDNVSTEMSLHVLAYNMKRCINLFGVAALLEAIREMVRLQALLLGMFRGVVGGFQSHCLKM